MTSSTAKRNSRRAFLREGSRALLLGGFVLTGLLLGVKKPVRRGRDNCRPALASCKNCSRVERCLEPEAVEIRRGPLRTGRPREKSKEGRADAAR